MASDEKTTCKRRTSVPPSPLQSPAPPLLVEGANDGDGGGGSTERVVASQNVVISDMTRSEETGDSSFIPEEAVPAPPPPVLRWPLLPDLNGPAPHDFDLSVTTEMREVARKSYPHSRHHCIKFPFKTTPHEQHCELCYCFVCDSAAPCSFWTNERNRHCDAGEFGHWKNQRELKRKVMENKRNKKNKKKKN